MIEITDVDLIQFAKKVYELSNPQGLGFLHFTPKPLTDEEAKELVDNWKDDKQFALDMDYVSGRACKMTVYRENGNLLINDNWYDHTDEQYKELLETFNIKLETIKEHGPACNCITCRINQGV